MFTHFSILFVILIAALLWEKPTRYNKIWYLNNGDYYAYRGPLAPWVLVFGYLAILAGFRSGMNDTSVYIASFVKQSASWQDFFQSLSGDIRYRGTTAITILFKMLISQDYHMWFLTWAVVESCLFINVLRRESVSFLDACFYFFASTIYYNYFSMMRQWMAVTIIFWGSIYLRDNKMLKYFFVCFIAAMFHTSALVMIPLSFIVKGKAWSGKQLGIVFLFSISMVFLNPLLSGLEAITEGTTYDYVISTMRSNSGSSIIRAFIAAVPVILAYFNREKTDTPMMNICINMSLVNLMLNILASVTSGLFIIRLSTYIGIYNGLLYPYLLNVTYAKNNKLIKVGFYIIYLAFFVYQMGHQGSWGYKSDVLTWLSQY